VRIEIVRTPLAWLIVAFVVLAAAGCGGASRPNTATNARTPAGTGAPARNISVQLWRFYRYGGREPGVADVIDYAEQVVEANCLHRAGFSYWPVASVVPSGVSLLDDGLSEVPSGVAPPEAAVLRIERKQGYGVYTEVVLRSKPMAAAPKANSDYFMKSLSPAEQNRFQLADQGNPRRRYEIRFPGGGVESGAGGGCIAKGAKTMYGSVIRNALRYNAGNNLQHLVGDRVFAMPTIKSATKRWARCMQKRTGHDFATPGAAVGWVRSQYYGTKGINRQTRKLEIRYSTTSTRCRYQSGFASLYAAATWKVLRTMPLSWYRSIFNAQKWNASAVVKARAILSSSRS
jgi:hypothetical protein